MCKAFQNSLFCTTGLSCQIWKGTYRRLFYGIEVWSGATYIYRVLQAVKEKPTEESFNDFLAGIEVHEQKIYASAKPDMNYISGSDKRCLDAAITKYKDTDPYDLSDLSHDLAWKEARARIKDNPQRI